MTVLIFANGDFESTGWVRPYLNDAEAIVAVDGGLGHLRDLGVQPSVVLGDFDSVPAAALAELEAAGVPVVSHPAAKDETDLELGLLYAVANYDGDLLVFGALGGRLDQMLANILLLAHPRLRGRRVVLMGEQQRIWLIEAGATAASTIDGEAGDIVSLIPLGGAVHVTSTTGLRWPLRDELLDFGPARGISNVIEQAPASVSISSGALFCVHMSGAWRR